MSTAELDENKISHEIFSVLESKFLFGCDDPKLVLRPAATASQFSPAGGGKVRILSIDSGGATDGLLAAASLVRLESSLRKLAGNPAAQISDFFDVAAGSGAGGVLVALLFVGGANRRPLFSASEAFDFLVRHRRVLQPARKKKAGLAGLFLKDNSAPRRDRALSQVFGALTLRDAVKPVLIPCFDLTTGAPFLFSRADAAEADSFDFPIRDVCAATAGGAKVRSVDGRTVVAAVDGGAAAGNPTAAAITHVLNNRSGFPFAAGIEDLFVVSLGNGESGTGHAASRRGAAPATSDLVGIAEASASDMVDQAVSMAFGDHRTANYVRVQGNMCDSCEFRSTSDATKLLGMAGDHLGKKNVESVLFRGKRVSRRTHAETLEWVSAELMKEHEGRKDTLPVHAFRGDSARSSLSSTYRSPVATASPR